MGDAPLAGITVLDLTQFEAGPSCTEALAWHGANVIKVEEPRRGDQGRLAISERPDMDSLYFILLNCNKRSITCNLKEESGKQLLRRLIAKADVLIENFAPGAIERLGFGWDELQKVNPRLVFAQVKGFATDGPYAKYLSFDMIAQATGGVMSITGMPDGVPIRPGATIGDTGTGLHMCVSILSALFQRERTGRGQHLQVAMQDAMTNYCRVTFSRQPMMQDAAPRLGNSVASGAPGGLFPCKGGGPNDYCFIFVARDLTAHWERVCKAIGREDMLADPRFCDGHKRIEHKAEIEENVSAWTRERTKQEVMEAIGSAGVPAGAVFDIKDLISNEDMHRRGIMQTVEHPDRGAVVVPAWPVRFGGEAIEVARAPLLGEHNEAVLGELLDMPPAEVADLKQAGAL